MPWTATRLSFTVFQSLLKLMSIESLMPSNHLVLCHPLLLPSIFSTSESFQMSRLFSSRWPKYWSFSFNISPSNEHPGLIPLEWTRQISLQSKGLSRVFFNTTFQKNQFFGSQLSYSPTLTSIHDHWKNRSLDLDGPLLAK